MKARSLPDVSSNANGGPGLAALGRVGPVLLVLTPTRLVGWDAKGKRLLCDVPVAQLSGVATEPSIGLISRVLVIQAGDTEVRIDAIRGAVARFAELLAQRIGQPVDVRRKEQSFWLLRAFVIGSLYFFGVSSVLLSIPQYSDKGPASAAFWLAAGLVMVCLGEFARRRLLSRRRRSVEVR